MTRGVLRNKNTVAADQMQNLTAIFRNMHNVLKANDLHLMICTPYKTDFEWLEQLGKRDYVLTTYLSLERTTLCSNVQSIFIYIFANTFFSV